MNEVRVYYEKSDRRLVAATLIVNPANERRCFWASFVVESLLVCDAAGGFAMSLEIEATYENGLLKPDQELPLQNGQRVKLTVQKVVGPADRLHGMLPWKGDLEEFDRWLNDPDEGAWGNRDV
jgi:predicted DNA-binding antitoxin AbrB/MazE fold protein